MAASSSRRNSSTWRTLACRLGLIRPSPSASPSARNSGSSAGSSRSLSRSCPRSASTGSSRSLLWTTAWFGLVTRSWCDWVVVSTCQLANGSSSSASTASRARVPDRVVVGVGLRGVVRRDLEVSARLEVDVAELGPPPRPASSPSACRRPPRGPARPGRAGGCASGRARGAAARSPSTAATTTITSSPARATEMIRRRWRGFTWRVYGGGSRAGHESRPGLAHHARHRQGPGMAPEQQEHAFDFWIGEWEVHDPEGERVGSRSSALRHRRDRRALAR